VECNFKFTFLSADFCNKLACKVMCTYFGLKSLLVVVSLSHLLRKTTIANELYRIAIMQKDALNNVHITDEQILITPDQLKAEFPLSIAQEAQIEHSRQTISDIIAGRDPRLLVVCGPCSIHDPETAIEYARRFKALAEEVSDSLYLVMRVYFEKPRTTVGWKGLINDPHMDGSFDVEAGLKIARRLLVELVSMGLPLATEALDPNSPQYLGDLFSWSAIGARTTESQTHREMASGCRCRLVSKTGPTAAWQRRLTQCVLRQCRTVLSVSTRRAGLPAANAG
jgi:3-deoxy-7-phosphoheptulonate synthase